MRLGFAFLILSVGCSRNVMSSAVATPEIDSGSIAQNDAAVIDAAVARVDCAEPASVVQLQTVNDRAAFVGETLIGEKHAYDPETLVATDLPAVPPRKAIPTSTRYADVAGDVGLIWKDGDSDATVEDVSTHKRILRVDMCAAGGFWTYSLSTTGRFLICDTNRTGARLGNLRAAHPDPERTIDMNGGPSGEGLALSPDDSYAIALPVLEWGTGGPSRSSITYFNLDTHKSKSLAKASNPEINVGNVGEHPHPYDVTFCGDGTLFATSGEKELTVYRKDGARLAGAPALKGGAVSFSASGKYLSQTRDDKTTVFRLDL